MKIPFLGSVRADRAALGELRQLAAALDRSLSVIEFALDGTILRANDGFLKVMGYSAAEVVGRHHSLFVDAATQGTPAYKAFWEHLRRGEYQGGKFLRRAKGGRAVWLEATYNPVFDGSGSVVKVIKFATDVTAERQREADTESRLAAVNRSQGVIEFGLDGTVLDANANFLKTLGYTLDEIRGRHHSVFVTAAERDSPAYREFWEKLGRGEFDAGQYRRIGKGNRDIWIQASYNPILDPAGRPYKVMKVATDITAQHEAERIASGFRSALENVTSNVMVADNDNRITYMNLAAREMMTRNQGSFRRDLPRFDAATLIGTSIDTFHRHPGHQKMLLAALEKPFRSKMTVGGRSMTINANAMLDDSGRRIGTVVEWGDRTQEVETEAEVEAIVSAALEGQLDRRIRLEGKSGFFEKLAQGINSLLDNMSGLVGHVTSAAVEVRKGADEISQGSLSLSQRTEEQASSLEETASSMEEITSAVAQNADNSARASDLAQGASRLADRGGEVVNDAVRAMSGIHESSRRIGDIIGVIDEIAFQTNLLALNAAVEAARAGEQGRGFAVVAAEVRNLAGRSATAAKEIKRLIQDSVGKVEQGSTLVTQSGETLREIVGAVKKVSAIVQEIAAASAEQSSGIEQVNKAVMQLDQLTQQNAALVEQSSAASQAMAEQARDLTTLMERYDRGTDAGGGAAGQPLVTSRRGLAA